VENSRSEILDTGLKQLAGLLQGLHSGDNVVWQTGQLEDYSRFAQFFITKAISDGSICVYFRFAPHPPVLEKQSGLEIIQIDPAPGFDYFSGRVHDAVEKHGKNVCYVFDNLVDVSVAVYVIDIDNTAVLVEVALQKAGYEPELSYGTHFFQDLVEADIIYIPVYPDEETSDFNRKFFRESKNLFNEALPEFQDFAEVVHIFEVPSYAEVVVDPKTRNAVCFLH
jgi:hypothetical protein